MTSNPATLKPSTASVQDQLFDRYLGSMLGSAIADALGWITEFRGSKHELEKRGIERLEDFISWSKPTGGRFHTYYDYVSEGEYSDDTQLTLCTARSLRADGSFDHEQFVTEIKAWLDYARGAGAAITAAARNLRNRRTAAWNRNFYGTAGRGNRRGYLQAGGNGAAMRVAPHGMANRRDPSRAFEGAWRNAIITHGHPRALIGAVTMAEAVRVLAENGSGVSPRAYMDHIEHFVAGVTVPDDPAIAAWHTDWDKNAGSPFSAGLQQTKGEMAAMLRLARDTSIPYHKLLTDLGCFKPATKGSGTGCVAAALGAFLRWPNEYRLGILEIVNALGIDTDTIGAMYGSLAGMVAGSIRVPDRWSAQMQDYEYFISAADALSKIGLRRAKQNDLVVDVEMIMQREASDIVKLVAGRVVSKNRRIVHDLLGPGWVRGVNDQTIRSGGHMLLVDVVFDSGQTVKFKSFQPVSRVRLASFTKPPRNAPPEQQSSF